MENSTLRDITPTFVSDDLKIQNIFHFKWWTVDEGLDYIQGIFGEFTLTNGTTELQMLDGQRYPSTEYQDEIQKLEENYALLKQIWDRSGRKRERYSPDTFLKWGLEHRQLSKMPWYEDAVKKQLVKYVSDPQKTRDEKPLNPKSKTTLLKIIAGLTELHYKDKGRGLYNKIIIDFQEISENRPSLHIDKDTLRNNIKEALTIHIPEKNTTDI